MENKIFAKGRRGLIYLEGKIAVKVKNPESEAEKRIDNEAYWLQKLNKYGIGPEFVSFSNNELRYKFVDGEFILDFIERSDKNEIINVLKDVFQQMFILDKLGINKLEMTRPVKHIIVTGKKKAVLIDFERVKKTEKPKNVTQFVQFVVSKNILDMLDNKGIKINREKMLKLAREYKRYMNKKSFNDVLSCLE